MGNDHFSIRVSKNRVFAGLACVLAFFFLMANTGCNGQTESRNRDNEVTEDNYSRLQGVVQPPKMEDSQERRNLVRRLEIFNNPDKVSYIYLIDYGHVVAYYSIKGKVSSVDSQLNPTDTVVGSSDRVVVEAPQLDGSYGTNGDAIFFFTAEGVYVEWQGDYLLADQPLRITQPVELVQQVPAPGTSPSPSPSPSPSATPATPTAGR